MVWIDEAEYDLFGWGGMRLNLTYVAFLGEDSLPFLSESLLSTFDFYTAHIFTV